ncbi:QcrA and Rieske domain-containing protein [Pseudonocardia nigra]|uniref:QcrA and Rieske domain-containing protein n=1 Tax=Pseudonocardia nigra TaxID=1921578 RepID=UPI001C5ED53F|nr:Rieske (2Fe-2S) protein [Pseudonocardia nigra]
MSESSPASAPVSRRTVVVAAGALGAGVVVTGCSVAETGTGGGAAGAAPAGAVLGPASEVPVGGGRIYDEQGVVVTQPTEGEFAAFSTVCPHQGCTVNRVADAAIVCPCHGSTFALDGAVTQGPATTGLETRAVTVTDGRLTLA